MNYDEARLKHAALVADERRIEHRSEWAELAELDRLMRSVHTVRARLGLRVLTNE
jgi:hypothetical protein